MNEIETRFYLQEINLCLKCIYNSQDIYKRQRLQKFKETGYLQNIYQNELDKACFEHEMAYGDFKDLEEQLLIKYCVIKQLILVKIEKMMDI